MYSISFLKYVTVCLSVLLFSSHISAAESIKVAFIGDQGVRGSAESVLSLVANEGTDLLLIQGDLGYDDNTADTWDRNLDNFLGKNFPVLTVIGNHENFEWPKYQRLIQQRIDRIDGLSCSGNTGVKSKCSYGNIDVVQVAPGIYEVPGINAEDKYADFIRSSFPGDNDRWRICSWHKPHKKMQTGTKTGPSGWDVYNACLDAGAMVALAHNHAYSRTYLLSDFERQTVVHRNDEMSLQSGQSFAFVSGLGGRGIKGQSRGGDYFASIYTADQGAASGALFCDFEGKTASCYFKAVDGAVPDQFSLTRGKGTQTPAPVVTPAPPPPVSETPASDLDGYVFSRSDKNELRWIALNANGQWGSTWIDQECAASFGGATATGNWRELMRRAPGFDTIANPCVSAGSDRSAPVKPIVSPALPDEGNTDGFAFSRTDKNEYRWIEMNSNGILGSIWIDKACVDRAGGVKKSGDWKALMALAPGFDTIASPCY